MISHGRLAPLDREMILCLRESRSVVRRTFSQWLTDVLVIPSGPFATFRFEFERQPVTQLWADCIDSGLWTEYVHTGPSQYGKSLLGYIAPLIYHLHELREHCVMGVPMADMAAAKWERDILPVLQASPELRQLIPTTGSGSSGGKIRDMVTLGNGQILKIISAGGDDVNKASFTSRIVAITEAARFSEGAESSVEAEPFAQLQARQRGYTAELRRTFVEGTLTIEEELPWSLREHSTKSRIVTPCPHCRAWITPGRANLMGWQEASTDREARDKAYFVCPECSKKITDLQRKESVAQCRLVHDGQTISKRGKVSGPIPPTFRLWFHVQGWHNLLLSAGDLAVDEWHAARVPDDSPRHASAQKKLCQFVWSVPYVPPKTDSITIDARALWQRQLPLPRGKAPADTQYLTTGVDLGSRIGWFVTLAIRSNGTVHVVDYDSFDIPSDTLGLDNAIMAALRQLRDVLSVGWQTEDGRTLPPRQVWVDAGFRPKPVLNFVRESGSSRQGWIFASIGRGQTQMAKTRYVAPKKTGNMVREVDSHGLWHLSYVPSRRSWEITFDSDAFKVSAHAGMVAELGKPGAITLFIGTAKTHYRICAHWANEQLQTEWDPKRGEVQKWHRHGANHLLDCTAMGLGAATRCGFEPIVTQQDVESPTQPDMPPQQPPQTPQSSQKNNAGGWYANQKDRD